MKTQVRGNIYKGPASSEEFNAIYNDAADDIKQLFSDLDAIIAQKEVVTDVLTKENMFLYNRIRELSDIAERIEDKVDKLIHNDDDGLYLDGKRFNNLNGISRYDTAFIDTVYRVATLRSLGSPLSRTHIYSAEIDETYIPSGLEIQLTESASDSFPSTPTVTSRTDPTLLNAINENSSSYYVRTVERAEGVNTLYIKLTVKIPMEFVNSPSCNAILINPFPSFSMSLYKVEYKNLLGQVVTLFNTENTSLARTSINFETVNAQEFYLYFKQKPICQNNVWQYIYGFQAIDILFYDTTTTEGSFVTQFTLPTDTYYQSINEPVTEYAPLTQVPIESNLVIYQLYTDEDLQNEIGFNTEILAEIGTVYMKTTIKRSPTSKYAPVLKGFRFDYMIQ